MSYPGAKGLAGTFHRIIGQMAPHEIYCEPFFGSGQVFGRKRPAPLSIINDLDAQTVEPFRGHPGVVALSMNAIQLLNATVGNHVGGSA